MCVGGGGNMRERETEKMRNVKVDGVRDVQFTKRTNTDALIDALDIFFKGAQAGGRTWDLLVWMLWIFVTAC